MSRGDEYVPVDEVRRAGVRPSEILVRVNMGKWGQRMAPEGHPTIRVADLPKRVQQRIRKNRARLEQLLDQLRGEQARQAFETLVGLQQIPPQQRGRVKAGWLYLLGDRAKLLHDWSEMQVPRPRAAAAAVSRAWVEAAEPIADLYPQLLIYPLPRELDALAAAVRRARSPGEQWYLLAQLGDIRLDEQALQQLRTEAQG